MNFCFKNIGRIVNTVLACLTLTFASHAFAATASADSANKAKIVKYIISAISWPQEGTPADTFTLCVMGKSATIKSVHELEGETIQNRKIKIKEITNGNAAKEACQLIYLTKAQDKQADSIIKQFADKPIFLLADADNFANRGGSANFVNSNGHLAITMNLDSLKKSHLSVDLNNIGRVIVVPEKGELK